VANSGGLGGSFFQRFGQKFSDWLESNRVPKVVQILVGVFLFVAGIAFQLLLEKWGFQTVFGGKQGYIWLIICLFAVSAIVLTIVASVLIGSLNLIIRRATEEGQSTRDKVEASQKVMLDTVQTTQQEVERGREDILDAVQHLVGLAAEYIDDRDRAYQRTRDLILHARQRLIFVDWWVDAPQFDSTNQARRDYYQAITDRIERHLDQSRKGNVEWTAFSHARIVQMPHGSDLDTARNTLSQDEVFWEHIKTCVELQEEVRNPTSVEIAEPFTLTHFAIIDDIFVQPILTLGKEQGLTRYGAILYTDRHGEVIRRYEQLIRALERQSLKKEHIINKVQTS
jgi:hypothetical protein